MKIKADHINGYKFEVSHDDLRFMPRGFREVINPTSGGLGYKVLSKIPETVVMGNPLIVELVTLSPIKTYQPKTAFSFLSDHLMTIDAEFGSVVTMTQAAIPKPYQAITSDGYSFICNHIPQLFQSISEGQISGIAGDFNWKTRRFSGMLFFGGIDASI